MDEGLTSIQNPRIKRLFSLQKPRERKKQQAFAIEGIREVSLAIRGGYEVLQIFICPEFYSSKKEYPIDISGVASFEITPEIFNKLAYRKDAGGILAVARSKQLTLNRLPETKHGLYIIVEQVEKPGNLGAILRTADAACVAGLVICEPVVDVYNPNVVRSSVGCLFTVPIAVATNQEVLDWLRDKKIKSFAASLEAKKSYYNCDFTKNTALLFGSEAHGLSDFWLKNADEQIIIPMYGNIDSMNVSNTVAVLTFEALRQRKMKQDIR